MTTPCGYQQITDASASIGLTVPVAGALPGQNQAPSYCLVIAEAQAIRYRDDGTPPTAAIGMPLAVGAVTRYDGPLKNIRFIQQTAGAIINIIYYY